jgi:large subunit ribosomal protein L22
MEAIAKTRHLKGSPRKARLVIDMIRGVNVSRALAILQFTDKRAAEATFKAEKQNIAIDPDDLYVKACYVDMGAHKNRRRMRPAPQGRAYREQRHYCHITIEVSNDKPAAAADEGKVRNAKTAAAASDGETKSATSKRAATKKTDAGERTAKAKQSDEKPQVVAEAETATAANTANEEAAEGNVEATATPTEEKQA